MEDFATRQRKPQRHALGMSLVVVLHLLLLWAIQSGLSRTVTDKVRVIADVMLLTQDRPTPVPTPPPPKSPPPAASTKTPPVPTATDTPVLPPSPAANAVSLAPAAAAPSATPPAARAESVRTAAVVNAAYCEKPDYPSASRRLEEEGTVQLRFLVGVDGKVIQAEVEKSSGYKRLDEAARSGLSKCQFRPATVDGKPEQAWASMRYTWRLE